MIRLGITLLVALGTLLPGTLARELRVGIYENPPQLFRDDDGEPAGIYMDFLRDVAEQEGWDLTFVDGNFSDLLIMLEAAEIDLLPSVALSYERILRFDFGRIPVLENWAVLHRREGVIIHNIFDLEGRTVYGLEDGIHLKAFRALAERYGVNCTIVGAPSYADAMRALETGEADAAVVNRTFSTREGGNYATVASSFIFNPIPLHFAVPMDRNRDVIHALDRELAVQREDPDSVLQASMNRWLRPPEPRKIPTWLYLTGGGLAAGVVLLLLLNRTLSHLVRQRTAQLEREKANTVAAMRAQNLFLATLSHELRTPLNHVRGTAELLRDHLADSPEAAEEFRDFEIGVERLDHLFTSLLRFAEMDHERFELAFKPVDLRKLFDEVDATARMLERAEGVELNNAIVIDEGDRVLGDAEAIFQIAFQLVHNAIKYTEKGEIILRVEVLPGFQKKKIRIEVTDTGPGIPDRDLEAILLPFKKGTTEHFVEGGAGLGLTIVKRLVDSLGGELTVRSKVGEGSTFTVNLELESADGTGPLT